MEEKKLTFYSYLREFSKFVFSGVKLCFLDIKRRWVK